MNALACRKIHSAVVKLVLEELVKPQREFTLVEKKTWGWRAKWSKGGMKLINRDLMRDVREKGVYAGSSVTFRGGGSGRLLSI